MPAVLPVESEQLPLLEARGVRVSPGRAAMVAAAGGAAADGFIEWSGQDFESEQLGIPVARIDRLKAWNEAAAPEILAALAEQTLARLRADGVRLISCRLPEDETVAHGALEITGFSRVERLLTLSRPIPETPPPGALAGLMRPGDAAACAALAGAVFTFDRFHADSAIDDAAADKLKAAWVANSCAGRADAMFVTREGETVTGFNACMLRETTAIIDLIGVAADRQGTGLGGSLVDGALAHYIGRAETITVGTQSNNFGSLELYDSRGFRQTHAALTFHAHP